MSYVYSCLSCNKTFKTLAAVASHARAKGHIGNPFGCSTHALESHVHSSVQHKDDLTSAVNDGLDISSSDWSEDDDDPYCDGCQVRFTDSLALNQHLAVSPKHNWCFECSRDFKSKKALLLHLNSLAHHPRHLDCPFCAGMFKSTSGVALHIESECHRITRHQVTAAVRTMDVVPNIMVKSISGPVTTSPSSEQITYIPTDASFNGSKYQCYLCPRSFKTISGLASHLNSPAHDDNEFICPECKTEFKLVSGFLQHFECGACALKQNKEVQDRLANLTNQFSHLLTA